MPSASATFTTQTYASASQLPKQVWQTFAEHPRNANLLLPFAEKLLALESLSEAPAEQNLWIVCMSLISHGLPIEFVLSCTRGPLGNYPIFVFTPLDLNGLEPDFVEARLRALVHALQVAVPPERVFSVFAPEIITRTFASLWTEATEIPLNAKPEYYAACILYCDRHSFRPRQMTKSGDSIYTLRLAEKRDIPSAVPLCWGFADESDPFQLSIEDAHREATLLIQNKQLWVHEITQPGQPAEIASIVAVTRSSDTVAAISKVYTNPRWRKRGCAERLTRRVCQHLLKTKESVVLYVAHNNPAAAKVYHRVGFKASDGPVDGVDRWLELGFARECVNLGHW